MFVQSSIPTGLYWIMIRLFLGTLSFVVALTVPLTVTGAKHVCGEEIVLRVICVGTAC